MARSITPDDMKKFIIETLGLEDIEPADIDADAPLFGGGLGLDSIDALELGIALKRTYGVQTSGENPATREHFRSVNTLVALVSERG